MKVLFIDDEPLARVGIRSIIPWEENGFRLVGEAKNGVEGLSLAKEYSPDLILVDLIMPEMDGMEFIRRVKELLPGCKIIIMSCMNDVHYFKEAIRYGVSEYILKDKINPEEILETVRRVANELKQERVLHEEDETTQVINRTVVLTEFMNLVLQGRLRDRNQIAEKLKAHGLGQGDAAFFVGCIQIHLGKTEDHEENNFLVYSALNICQEIVSASADGAVLKAFDGNLAAIIKLPVGDLAAFQQRLFGQLSETVEQCLDCKITMGVSALKTDLAQIDESYQEALAALNNCFFHGQGKLYCAADEGNCPAGASVEIDVLFRGILRVVSVHELALVADGVTKLSEAFATGGDTYQKAKEIYADVFSHLLSLLRREELDLMDPIHRAIEAFRQAEPGADSQEIASRMCAIVKETQTVLGETGALRGRRILLQIQGYIDQHLEEKITLSQLAKAVYLSPSYVCRLFKRETGENLQDYVMKKKIEKAITLLNIHSVGEVADLLGFQSHSYFIRVFKEATGQTPLHFQKTREQ